MTKLGLDFAKEINSGFCVENGEAWWLRGLGADNL